MLSTLYPATTLNSPVTLRNAPPCYFARKLTLTIAPDIMGPAAYVAHHRFTLNAAVKATLLNDPAPFVNQDFVSPGQPNSFEIFRNAVYAHLEDFRRKGPPAARMTQTSNLPQPTDVINAYANTPTVASLVNWIFEHCERPTYLPIMNRHVYADNSNVDPDAIAVIPFVLVHAVQLLIFSPTDFAPDRVYSRDRDAYPHRYPTQETYDNAKLAWGQYTMEDMNRAVICFFNLLSRRSGNSNTLLGRKPTGKSDAFPGYMDSTYKPGQGALEGGDLATDIHIQGVLAHDIAKTLEDNDKRRALQDKQKAHQQANPGAPPLVEEEPADGITGLDAMDLHGQVMEAIGSTNLRQTLKEKMQARNASEMPPISEESLKLCIKSLEAVHQYGNPDEALGRIQRQVSHTTALPDGGDMAAYMANQVETENVMAFAQAHPEDLEGLHLRMRQQFALEMRMNSIQPGPNPCIEYLCERYKIRPWPEINLYPDIDGVQDLKPHQLIGKFHPLPPPPPPEISDRTRAF